MHGMTAEDRAQVKAILMTHAEMQDHRTMETEQVMGRLKHEGGDDEEVAEMIEELQESVTELTADSENLKRLANHF